MLCTGSALLGLCQLDSFMRQGAMEDVDEPPSGLLTHVPGTYGPLQPLALDDILQVLVCFHGAPCSPQFPLAALVV